MSTPSESEQLMTFDLQAYSLDQGQSEFEALSYTWDHPVCDDFKDDLLHTNGNYRRDDRNIPGSIREAIPKRQVFSERKFRMQFCVNSF